MKKETLNATVENNETKTNLIKKGRTMKKEITSKITSTEAVAKNSAKLLIQKEDKINIAVKKDNLELITILNTRIVENKTLIKELNKNINIDLMKIFSICKEEISNNKKLNSNLSKREIITGLKKELDRKNLDKDTNLAYNIAYNFISSKIEVKDTTITFNQLKRIDALYALANKKEIEININGIKYTVENKFYQGVTKNGINNAMSIAEYLKGKNKALKNYKIDYEKDLLNNSLKIITATQKVA